VYLDVRRTQDELDRNSRPLPQNQADAIYAGRRFELYATEERFSVDSDHRARCVSQEEEYCGLFSLKLAETRLIVAAEIDCYDAHDDRTGNYAYVELKTTRVLKTDKDRYSFERYKLLSFWIQSFIVGTPRIVCGFRDDQFQLQKLQSFTTTEIPSFCRKHWVRTSNIARRRATPCGD
jgi:RAT1-interacting protein